MALLPPVNGTGGPGKVPLNPEVPLEGMVPVPVGNTVPIVPVAVPVKARFCFEGSASE